MSTVAKLHVPPPDCHYRTCHPPPVRLVLRRGVAMLESRSLKGRCGIWVRRCRSFKLEEGESEDFGKKTELGELKKVNRFVGAVRSVVWSVSKPSLRTDDSYREALEKLEEKLFVIALHLGRYIVTMMSTGVILLTGFQLSGGDEHMNALIWYSWLGGIIIGTMIGTNWVLDEVSRAGPRNVVITGSTRGLGKALAREFLLSGDRVVVASRSPESVEETIKELQESLKQVIISSNDPSIKKLKYSRVVGIACDVSNPEEVTRLADFAVKEFGSIDIWVNDAGANKGFRPLL